MTLSTSQSPSPPAQPNALPLQEAGSPATPEYGHARETLKGLRLGWLGSHGHSRTVRGSSPLDVQGWSREEGKGAVVDRTMVSHRCPSPNPWNRECVTLHGKGTL